MAIKYSNNAKTTVSAAGITGTTINVVDASTFPIIDSVDDYTYITLLAGSTAQIFKADTIDHANNVIIVDVAPDSAVFVPNSTRVELRLTAELLSGVMDTHEHTLDGITGVTLSTPLQDQVLTWNGAAWTNAVPAGSGGNVSGTLLDGGDASGIFTGVSIAEQSSGQGVTVYPDAAALVSVTLVTGALAYVQDIDKLLLCTGTAWSSVAISNEPPTVSFSATAINRHYQEPSWVGYSDITVTATDPDGVVPTITIESNTMGNGATVEVIGNTLVRVTPNQTYEYGGDSFVIKVTDGDTIILQTITVDYAFMQNVIGQQNFFSSATWTVPTGVTMMSYMAVAGGQGGGGSVNVHSTIGASDRTGYDGAPGGRKIGSAIVTAGTQIAIAVGFAGPVGDTYYYYNGYRGDRVGEVGGPTTIAGITTADGGYGGGVSTLYWSDGYNLASDSSWMPSGNNGAGGAKAPMPAPPTSQYQSNGSVGSPGKAGAVRLIWGNINGQPREFGTSLANSHGTADYDTDGNLI